MPESGPEVLLRKVTKRFGELVAVDAVDLEVARGEVVYIIGPSGSGKSTMLRCINALEIPDEGAVIVGGETVDGHARSIDSRRSRMGMVFQDFQLFGHLSVLGNLTLAPRKVLGVPLVEAEIRARTLLDRVGLKFEVVKSGEHKDLGSPYREFSEADRALLQEVVDDVYEQFVDVVVEERGLSRDSVMKVADGRLLSGRRALQYGLIDGHGDVVDAITQAGMMSGLGPDPRVVRPEQRRLRLLDLFISAARWSARWSEAASSLSGFWSDRWLGDGPRLWYLTRYH